MFFIELYVVFLWFFSGEITEYLDSSFPIVPVFQLTAVPISFILYLVPVLILVSHTPVLCPAKVLSISSKKHSE